jgi:transcriptional regulator with XRE-family HTH domain
MKAKLFATRLKEQRTKAKMTQARLARCLGLGVSSVTNMEKAISAPSARSLERICQTLNVRPDYLMGWTTTPKASPKARKQASGSAFLPPLQQ